MVIRSRRVIRHSRRIVIKIGSSVLLKKSAKKNFGGFSSGFFRALARQISVLHRQRRQILIVSSGAIAAGMQRLRVTRRPKAVRQKQALAALGQTALMHMYEKVFSKFGIRVAQILLDKEDISHRRRNLNARHAIHELWRLKTLPIVNENDTVAVDEIKVGDNDNLSALVARLVGAQLLILLTDTDGVYTADPRLHKRAARLPLISNIDAAVHRLASGTLGVGNVGGMVTKLQAAEKAAHFGTASVIAKGSGRRFLLDILAGKDCGTLILPAPSLRSG